MARVERWLTAQVRSYEQATRRVFNKGSQIGKEDAVVRYWQTAETQEVARWLDQVREASDRQDDGRPIRFARGGLLLFYVAALVLNVPVTEAYTFVQESHRMRKLLNVRYGWPLPSEETLHRIATARGPDEAPEEDFPSRQTVAHLIPWLSIWGTEDQIDESTGEITAHVDLSTLEYQAYVGVPVEIAERFGLDLSRAAIDGTRIKSPRRRNSGKRPDEGAAYMGRAGEKAMFGRLKMTAIATDLPVVLEGAFSRDAEITYVGEKLITNLRDRSEEMLALATQHRVKDFRALDDTLLVGDTNFNKNEIMLRIHQHQFRGAFRLVDPLTRKTIGTRRVRRTLGDHELIVDLDVCNDGVHLCPCDKHRHVHGREPMLQTAGPRGPKGHVNIQCNRESCERYSIAFYVPYRKPDRVFADGRREQGEIDYTLVSAVPRGLKDAEVAIFKGCQAIEHYHSQLLAKHGLGIKDTTGRRRISGDLRHRFYYALGDLIWNLTILFNLEDGFAHTPISPERIWTSVLRSQSRVRSLKAKKHSQLTEEATDAARGDEVIAVGKRKKAAKRAPTYAVYHWRNDLRRRAQTTAA